MTYLGSGDPDRRRNNYYPEWLDHPEHATVGRTGASHVSE